MDSRWFQVRISIAIIARTSSKYWPNKQSYGEKDQSSLKSNVKGTNFSISLCLFDLSSLSPCFICGNLHQDTAGNLVSFVCAVQMSYANSVINARFEYKIYMELYDD